MDTEVLEERFRSIAREQASLPERVEDERQPREPDRERDAAPEAETAPPRNQPDRLLRAVERVTDDEREPSGGRGARFLRRDGALLSRRLEATE